MPSPHLPIRLLLLALLTAAAAQGQTPTAPQPQTPAQDPAIPPTIVRHPLKPSTPGTATAPQAAPTSATDTPRKPRPKSSGPALNSNAILLDPGHGGDDNGAKLGEDSFEKDAMIAFAGKLRTALVARNFTVSLTHESAGDQLTGDQRSEVANRARAGACILLHASNGGHGVHLYTSSLPPSAPVSDSPDEPKAILPWDTAQSVAVPQSVRLAKELSDALYAIRIPLVVGHASVSPMDSMSCPTVALELSPLAGSGDDSTPASDAGYQQRIADAVVTALTNWRTHLSAPAPGEPAKPATKPATPPVKKPVVPKSIPVETPESATPAAPARTPAPIVRRPPPATPPGGSPPQ